MKRLTLATFLTTLLLAPSSHAFFDTFDKWFTFREDQKPLVAPTRKVTPIHVIVPNYNDQEAAEWSRYYTRSDLQAVDYLDSSTKVMRPALEKPARARHEPLEVVKETAPAHPVQQGQQQWQQPYAQPVPYPYMYYPGYPTGYAPYAPPSAYQMMQWRHHQNNMQQAREQKQTLYIGEAGSTPNSFTSEETTATNNVGIKAQLGDPVHGWKSPVGSFAQLAPQPGDYNYTPPAPKKRRPLMDDAGENGQVIAGANASAGTVIAGQGLVNEYEVRRGDSLSTISGQEQIYGNWQMWPLIYNANRNQIKDPDLIYPNQRLGIPRAYSDQEATDAQNQARNRSPYSLYDGQ